jgi:hypothetical protein
MALAWVADEEISAALIERFNKGVGNPHPDSAATNMPGMMVITMALGVAARSSDKAYEFVAACTDRQTVLEQRKWRYRGEFKPLEEGDAECLAQSCIAALGCSGRKDARALLERIRATRADGNRIKGALLDAMTYSYAFERGGAEAVLRSLSFGNEEEYQRAKREWLSTETGRDWQRWSDSLGP